LSGIERPGPLAPGCHMPLTSRPRQGTYLTANSGGGCFLMLRLTSRHWVPVKPVLAYGHPLATRWRGRRTKRTLLSWGRSRFFPKSAARATDAHPSGVTPRLPNMEVRYALTRRSYNTMQRRSKLKRPLRSFRTYPPVASNHCHVAFMLHGGAGSDL